MKSMVKFVCEYSRKEQVLTAPARSIHYVVVLVISQHVRVLRVRDLRKGREFVSFRMNGARCYQKELQI